MITNNNMDFDGNKMKFCPPCGMCHKIGTSCKEFEHVNSRRKVE